MDILESARSMIAGGFFIVPLGVWLSMIVWTFAVNAQSKGK